MPIETETSAQGRRKKIVAGPAFDIETNNGLTASNKLFIAGIGLVAVGLEAWTVGKLVYDHVVRLRNSETQPAVLQAELDDRLAALLAGNDDRQAALRAENDDRLAALLAEIDDRLAAQKAENDDRLAALQAENDVLRRELADARAEIDVLRGNPTS
jgi:hypothetical protein